MAFLKETIKEPQENACHEGTMGHALMEGST